MGQGFFLPEIGIFYVNFYAYCCKRHQESFVTILGALPKK